MFNDFIIVGKPLTTNVCLLYQGGTLEFKNISFWDEGFVVKGDCAWTMSYKLSSFHSQPALLDWGKEPKPCSLSSIGCLIRPSLFNKALCFFFSFYYLLLLFLKRFYGSLEFSIKSHQYYCFIFQC